MHLHKRKAPVFHGWYVLVASFIVLFLSGGSRAAIGVMVKPWELDLGWTREAISSAQFLNLALYALATIITGRLYDRYGPKWIVVGSTLLFAGGYALMAEMHSLWQLYLYFGVLNALGMAGVTVNLFGTLVGKWFERRRGLYVTLAFAGTCIGQFLLVPFISQMTESSGWRAANLWIAGVCVVVNLPLAFGILRGEPGDFGLEPFGRGGGAVRGSAMPTAAVPASAEVAAATPAPRDLTLTEAMSTPSLWLFTIALFACGSADFLVLMHLVAMVRDHGISDGVAASMLAWLGLVSLPGMLIAGPMAKRVGNKMPIAATFVLRFALFAMLLLVKNTATFWVFSIGFGLTLLVAAPLTTTLISDLYGLKHLGFITGFVNTVHTIGGGVGAYLGGVVFGHTGGYNAAFVASGAFAVVAAVCSFLIQERRHLPPGERVV
jgi:MFS family permease